MAFYGITAFQKRSASKSLGSTKSITTLLSLPEELINELVDHLLDITKEGHISAELRNFRLVSKRFTRNKLLHDKLFHSINLIGDQKYFDRVADADISNIVPYVRHVTFVPPLHSYSVDASDFEQLVRTGIYQGSARYPVKHVGKTIPTPEVLKTGYMTYGQAANRNIVLLHSNKSPLRSAWIRILRRLSHCTSFGFALVDYAELDESLQPKWPDCIVIPIGPRTNSVIRSEHIATVMADAFMPVAMSILAQSKVTIEHLSFSQAVGYYGPNFRAKIGWGKLDISNLTSLKIEPSVCRRARPRDKGFLLGLEMMLKNVTESLEELDCSKAVEVIWRGEPVPMTRLRTLKLAGRAESAYLVGWIENCPSLEVLELMSLCLVEQEVGAWRSVADAVRRHANKPVIEPVGDWDREALEVLVPEEHPARVRLMAAVAPATREASEGWTSGWSFLDNV